MRFASLSAVALFCCFGASLQAADEPKITVENDLVYTKVGDVELKVDMARPAEGDGPFPGVLLIHGGAWRAGNKADLRPALADFARRGYVAISPQYRFCPKDAYPAQLHDVKTAVRWLKSHAKDYKLDASHIGAVGFSAGAHLSMMLGVTAPADGLEGEVSADAPDSKIQAVVNYFGPTDLSATDFPEETSPLINDFVGVKGDARAKAVAQASPITFVTADDAPILSFQGTKDPLVPYTQAFKIADAQTAAGVPGRVELLIGAGHGWGGDELKRTMSETFLFFDTLLKPAKP